MPPDPSPKSASQISTLPQGEGRASELFASLIARRAAREPLAYITGHREFWSLDFAVGPGVLIPRPDTETLIEALTGLYPDRATPLSILDLGTGSACLLVAALTEYPNAHGVGIDASAAALAWACRNIAAHGLEARASLIEDRLAGRGQPRLRRRPGQSALYPDGRDRLPGTGGFPLRAAPGARRRAGRAGRLPGARPPNRPAFEVLRARLPGVRRRPKRCCQRYHGVRLPRNCENYARFGGNPPLCRRKIP